MASVLQVEELRGPSSGANANKVIIPSGQTLDISGGALERPYKTGEIVQTVIYNDPDADRGIKHLVATNGSPPRLVVQSEFC